MPTSRDELVGFLDEYLAVDRFRDASINGLQVEGKGQVDRVCLAVDACMESIQLAGENKAQLLLVHHGLFWGGIPPLVGRVKALVKELLQLDLSLYAAHLPLDTHKTVGNNVVLSGVLGLRNPMCFGDQDVGIVGTLDPPRALHDFAEKAFVGITPPPQIHAFGPETVRTVAVVTGSGTSLMAEAFGQGADCLVTGEPRHQAYHEAKELGINVIYAGHYWTETMGLSELGCVIEKRFGVETRFLDIPTGL